MQARAESAAATADRILDAAVGLFWEQMAGDIRLDDVAQRSGVTVQTVLRRFGSKDELFAAAVEREARRVVAERRRVVPGDVEGAVENLVGHYETFGDGVMRMLREEHRVGAVDAVLDRGRREHRAWCRFAFEPFLTGLDALEQQRRLAQLVTICDVYVWHLFRRQSGLSRAQTQRAITEMLLPFTGEKN